MTIGGKPKPIYVVTDAEIASGQFTIAPGPAITVSSLDALTRGVSGGPAMSVYVVDAVEANRRGITGGLQATPVVDATEFRAVGGLQQAVPVYVTYGSLGVTPLDPAQVEVQDNITAFHPLYEAGGNNRVDCINSLDSLEVSGPISLGSDGTFPYFAEFDGVQRLSTVDSTPGLAGAANEPFTIAGWTYFTSEPEYYTSIAALYSGTGGNRIWALARTQSTGIAAFVIYITTSPWAVTGSSSAGLSLNAWHFVVAVFDIANNQLRISIDGTSFNDTVFGYTILTGDRRYLIGAFSEKALWSMNGNLRHIMFFKNHALSQDAVDWVYNSGAGRLASEITDNPCVP